MSDMIANSTVPVLAPPANFGGSAPPLTTHHSQLTTYHSPLTTHQVGLLSFLVSEVALFGTLIVSYVVCSFDFEYMTANARIYWPRFVRVKLAPTP